MSVKRFDSIGALQKPQYLTNGWVRVDAFIARAGLLEYTRADGSKWVEYRPAEEHSAEALATFDAVPFTHNHPPAGLLDADNTKLYQVGTVLSPRADGEKVRASILITDKDTVSAIRAGKVELSCGYSCDVDTTPGVTPDGQHYDSIQRNVRGNHVALVAAGRAGAEVRLRLDGVDPDLCSTQDPVPSRVDESSTPPMPKDSIVKIRIDDVEFEVSEPAAQAVAKLDARIAELNKAVESEKARFDVASGEVEKLKAELANAPDRVRAEMQARSDLEAQARTVLGAEAKFDGKSTADIKREVAATLPSVKVDGKSDAYVDALFDLALVKAGEAREIAQSTEGTASVKTDSTQSDARQRFNSYLSNLHRSHLENK